MPRVWITHITGLMSDDAKCRWAAWFKARFTYEKVKDDDFDARDYRAKHKLARDQRVEELKAEGWVVRIEDAVKFELKGETVTLAGKPDIVAFKHDENRIRVEDPKTGQKYLKHWYQNAIYMRWIRKTLGDRYAGYSVEGALLYYSVEEGIPRLVERIEMKLEEITPEVLQVIVQELQTVGLGLPPERTPSDLECLYCDIPSSECPDRVIERQVPVEVTEF
jgi:hypothetical protein